MAKGAIMMAERHLTLVPPVEAVPSRVADAIKEVKPDRIMKDMKGACGKIGMYTVPRTLQQAPVIDDISPDFGMTLRIAGSPINAAVDVPHVHLDFAYLEGAIATTGPHLRTEISRYFVLSTVLQRFIMGRPEIIETAKIDPRMARVRSWQWAGAAALSQMQPLAHTGRLILHNTQAAARDMTDDAVGDFFRASDMARLAGHRLQSMAPVPEWVGLAHPKYPHQWIELTDVGSTTDAQEG